MLDGYQTVYNLNLMSNKKYESLRKKLDTLGFTQTLNPDTVELAEKLYNELYKNMKDLDEQRKKKSESSKGSLDSSLLYDRIDALTNERDMLARQLQEARSGVAAKENNQRLNYLNTLVNNFKIKQEQSTLQYDREVKKLSTEIASLKLKNEQFEKQNQILKGKAAQSSNEAERYTSQLAALVEKKGRQIRELEDANSKLRIRVQVLERNIEESKIFVQENKGANKEETERMQLILKQQLSQTELRYRQIKEELEASRDENDNLRRDLRRAREEALMLKKEETNTKTMENIGRAGKEKMEQMYEQARQQLMERNDQLKSVKDRVQQQERQRGKLQLKIKEYFNKIKFLTEQNSDLQTEIEHISSKSTLQIKRVRELEAVNVSLEKQLKQAYDDSHSQNKESVQQNLREEQAKMEQLRKELVVKERQMKLFEEELKVLKSQAEQRTIERDKAQMDVKKLQGIIAEGSRNIQSLQLQKEELMKENRELRSGKQILTSADSNAKSEIFVLREKVQASEGQIEQLRSILHGQQIRNKQLEAQIARLQSLCTKSEQKNVEIFEDNKLMANQIRILEQRKNELHDKVKELQEITHIHMEGNSSNRQQLDELMAKNDELQRQLARKDKALKQLDNEKDELQNELDQETSQKAKLREQLNKMQIDLREYSRAIEERQYMINQLQKKLSKSQDTKDSIDKEHGKLIEEEIKLRDRLMASEAELKSIQNQISLLVISNQQAQKQAERGKNKIAELDRRLKDRTRESEQQRQRATAMNILSNELQSELEKERAEVVRFRGFVGQLEEANNHMYQQLQRKDQQMEQLSKIIDENDRREQQYIHQINSYQRQLQNLTQDFESLQQQARRLSGEKEVLKAQRNWKKEVSSLTQDWRTKQQERFVDIQNDYQRVKMENQQLRCRCRDLQSLLSEQRAKNYRISQNLGTPTRTILVESRVESYHQGQNVNNSNVFARSRNQSIQSLDNVSQESAQSEIVQSAKLSLQQIERKFLQTSFPNMRGKTPNS